MISSYYRRRPGVYSLPAGDPKRLRAIKANDRSASFFPDGRTVFALDKDLYVAEKDGSSVRDLLTTPEPSAQLQMARPCYVRCWICVARNH